jgi:hypothetical protein
MTARTWSRIFDVLIVVVAFGIPLFTIFMMYVSMEETTSEMTISIVGVFLLLGVVFGIVKWLKRRITTRKEMGFRVSPYTIAIARNLGGVMSVVLFTLFLDAVKGEVATLVYVMIIWSVCALVSFILKLVQVHFDKLDLQQNA